MVSIPPGMSATGRRVRRFFEDEKKAQKFGAAVRAKHAGGIRGLIPVELAMEAVAASKILEPLGIRLIDAARMVAARGQGARDLETLGERWQRACLDGETRWSRRYAADMAKMPRWVGKVFWKLPCGEITDDRLRTELRAHGAAANSTVAMRRLRVMAVLNWREDRVQRLAGPVTILSVAQCARVLRAAETADQRRVVALLLFAGIRPDAEHGEISRMQWEAVGQTEIYLCPKTSKVGDRHVVITPRLRRLLRGHPASGPVMPAGWRRAWQRIRREAGIAEMQDVLRHTFASNFLAAFGEDAAKQAMGHTQGSTTLFRHYRRAVTEKDGKAFFK